MGAGQVAGGVSVCVGGEMCVCARVHVRVCVCVYVCVTGGCGGGNVVWYGGDSMVGVNVLLLMLTRRPPILKCRSRPLLPVRVYHVLQTEYKCDPPAPAPAPAPCRAAPRPTGCTSGTRRLRVSEARVCVCVCEYV